MTEVACSYKLEAKTYFDGIQYMDRYLKNKQRVVEAAELHALGVVAMFVATKAHEIFPLRIAVVCDKIGHRKISINKLCSVEADIIKTLDYQLNEWTFFDIASLSLSVFKDDFMLQILAYICRLVVIEYDFYNRLRPALIGEACAWLTLQILNKREPVWVSNKYEVMECGRMVLSLVSGFRSVHSGLKNADRFSDCAVVEKVFTYLETY